MIKNVSRFGRRMTIPSTVQILHELRTFVLKKDLDVQQVVPPPANT